LDPQGKAVTGALARLGFAGVTVRQGKRFELDVVGELTEERLAEVRRAAETLLANTVIETFNVRVEEAESAGTDTELELPSEVGTQPGKASGEAPGARVAEPERGNNNPQVEASAAAGTELAKGSGEARDARVEEPRPVVGNSQGRASEGGASDALKGTDAAVDSPAEESGPAVGNRQAEAPDRAAREPAKARDKARDAPVMEPEERASAANETTGTDRALDAGPTEPKETVEDARRHQQDGIVRDAQAKTPEPDAQAEPPTASGAR
jgi:phosphoribosylformylglycinamidine synthase subunit PurS